MKLLEGKFHNPLSNPTKPLQKSLEEHQQNPTLLEIINSPLEEAKVESL